MRKSLQKSFTLLEVLIYIGVLGILVVAISSFLIWSVHSNTKARVMRETLYSTGRAMEVMTHEIKEAKSVYTPTSVFDVHPGQLSLEITKHLPEGEETTYVDFYLCGTQLCLKKESQDAVVLTSGNMEVKNLVFYQIISEGAPSIQIDFKVEYKNPADRPEYRASVNLKSTASFRSY